MIESGDTLKNVLPGIYAPVPKVIGTELLGLFIPSLAVTEVEPIAVLEIVVVHELVFGAMIHVSDEKVPGSAVDALSKVTVIFVPLLFVVVLPAESRKVAVSVATSVPLASTVFLSVANNRLLRSASPAMKFTVAGEPFVMLNPPGVPLLNVTDAVTLAVPIVVLFT